MITDFQNNIIIIGFGSIGQSVLPLIFRHIDIEPSNITIINASENGRDIAEKFGVKFIVKELKEHNYIHFLSKFVKQNDFLLNVSVNVSSIDLIKFCRKTKALYLDTCIEPWSGLYIDKTLSPSMRSNYYLRERALYLKDKNQPTAVITHGANPGLVSHFVKQALLNIAADNNLKVHPKSKKDWSKLANTLDIKVIHIAERDTQTSFIPKKVNEFVNTWSVDGFISEGCQPAELGWGNHELFFPYNGALHSFGCGASIYLNSPGADTKIKSWTPLEGPYNGFLITHSESISIADYFTLKNGNDVIYRPTVLYAYHPCDAAVLSIHELSGKNWNEQQNKRILMNDIITGMDELGVLLMGNNKGVYWYGSQLSINQARSLVPYNNATSLQVSISILAGMIWAIKNPNNGVVEPDEIDHTFILDFCKPYLGNVIGQYSDWTPLQDREKLFYENIDKENIWQFKNFYV
jgi:homospermidine synthase